MTCEYVSVKFFHCQCVNPDMTLSTAEINGG